MPIDFDTDLQDLRDCSAALAAAGDAAEIALTALRGLDVPTGLIMPGLFGHDQATVDNAFGMTLGMPHVANAYAAHLAEMEKRIAQLHQSTMDASHALMQVAELYRQADEHGKHQSQAVAARMGES